jgi:putative ABC transport system permease protein
VRNQVSLVGTTTVAGRVTHLVFLLTAVLIVLAAINAIFTTWATVIDAQRPTALARALGATPRQVTAGLAASQLIPGTLIVVAALTAIPARIGARRPLADVLRSE